METTQLNEEYLEVHYEVVQAITIEWLNEEPRGLVKQRQEQFGHGGLYELAKEITDNFMVKYKDETWEELGFFETIENFIDEQLQLT